MEADKTELERIMGKIRKCLALGQSNNPNEAATAMRQAQALMAKYNIDAGTLEVADIMEDSVRSQFTATKVSPFELRLMNIVRDAFGCDLIWIPGSSYGDNCNETYGRYNFVGHKSQVPIAVYTATVLVRKLAKARRQYIQENFTGWPRAAVSVQGNGFCEGWVNEIEKTVIRFARPEAVTQAIMVYKEHHFGKLKTGKAKKSPASILGVLAGRKAAEGESLHRPMNETKLNRLSYASEDQHGRT
jgi:hypothetical protein